MRRLRLLALLRDVARGKLLEVGCGSGALLIDLDALGFRCTGVETSAAARDLASSMLRQTPGVRLLAEPASDFDAGFDVVGAFEVLEHIPDDRETVRLWRSWLKPGGLLAISVPAGPERWSASDVWVGHVRRYTRSGLIALLSEAGFVVEYHEGWGFPLANLTDRLRARVHRRRLGELGASSAEQRSAQSGCDRSIETRLWPLEKSLLGVTLLRLGNWAQQRTLRRELGTGIIALARKP